MSNKPTDASEHEAIATTLQHYIDDGRDAVVGRNLLPFGSICAKIAIINCIFLGYS